MLRFRIDYATTVNVSKEHGVSACADRVAEPGSRAGHDYCAAGAASATLVLYDMLGRHVRTLADARSLGESEVLCSTLAVCLRACTCSCLNRRASACCAI